MTGISPQARRRGLAELVLPGASVALYLAWSLGWLLRAASQGNFVRAQSVATGLYYTLLWVLMVGFLLPFTALAIYRWGRSQPRLRVQCAAETFALTILLAWLLGFVYTPFVMLSLR